MYRFLMERNRHIWRRWDASVVVGPLGEGASHPSDDDVGGVVSGADALLQRLLLHQRREEAWVGGRRQGRGQPPSVSLAFKKKKVVSRSKFQMWAMC